MDTLDQEIERTTQWYCQLVLVPGFREYVLDKVDTLAAAKPSMFADMKARVRAADEQHS